MDCAGQHAAPHQSQDCLISSGEQAKLRCASGYNAPAGELAIPNNHCLEKADEG